MIKRSTALTYVLITSFILLAHAVIPHHYHENNVFIVNSDCKTENGTHNHGSSEHNHHDHDETNSEICILQQTIVVPANEIRIEIKTQKCVEKNKKTDDFQAFLLKKGLNALHLLNLSKTDMCLSSSSYIIFVTECLGMRAPPLVV